MFKGFKVRQTRWNNIFVVFRNFRNFECKLARNGNKGKIFYSRSFRTIVAIEGI